MLKFCAVADIQLVLPAAGRYDTVIENAINGMTARFYTYMRRVLEFETGITEYFDVPNLKFMEETKIWLNKRMIVPETLVVKYSTIRDWEDPDAILVLNEDYRVDYEKGKITLSGYRYRTPSGLQVSYSGGFKAIQTSETVDILGVPTLVFTDTDVMDVPDDLKMAAITQVVFEVNELIQLDTGQQQVVEKKWAVGGPKLVSGLLSKVAKDLDAYKKPMGM